MRLFLATLGVVALKSAIAQHCTPDGVRAIGAEGYPTVVFSPCCSGSKPVTRDNDWGLFCPGQQKVENIQEKTDCYKTGERAGGQFSFPAIEFKPCCDPAAVQIPLSGHWGTFCVVGRDVDVKVFSFGVVPIHGSCRSSMWASEGGWSNCSPGLFCKRGSCENGICKSACSPTLAEGKKCGSATGKGPAYPSLSFSEPWRPPSSDGSAAELCQDGLSCQWRDSGKIGVMEVHSRDYFCRPVPTKKECVATIVAGMGAVEAHKPGSGCIGGTECAPSVSAGFLAYSSCPSS